MRLPVEQIKHAFQQGRTAFMPYFPLGYPDYQASLEIVKACVQAGADLMELGVPFSDPLADGPTLQHSAQAALEAGMTVQRAIQSVSDLRHQGLEIPLVMMTYYNPVYAFGPERFIHAAAEAGANGLIIPDLPPEEAREIIEHCRNLGLGLIFLLAPNSPERRIRWVCRQSSGFTYLVTVTGITGARRSLPQELEAFVCRTRPHARTPLAVGFGISTPEQARQAAGFADGVIVGSALVKKVSEALQDGRPATLAAAKFVTEMAGGISQASPSPDCKV